MQEEKGARKTSRFDPSMDSHRPASGKSQDISHVLASTFKDLYTKDVMGKDTLSNLIKTKTGQGGFHDRYVEELQQAHSEYNRSIKQADMLESHIIQARDRAAAIESQAYERQKEQMGDVHGDLGLLTVNSAFPWCVDQDLLKMNNLISPQDYLPTHKRPVRAPAPIKWNPAKPTIASAMHMSREHQDDGYTLMPSPKKIVPEMNESDLSLTLESSSDNPRRKKTSKERPDQTITRPNGKDEPSAEDRAEGRKKLPQLKDRNNFLCNPRFLPLNAQQGGASLIHPRAKGGKMEHVKKGAQKQGYLEEKRTCIISQ